MGGLEHPGTSRNWLTSISLSFPMAVKPLVSLFSSQHGRAGGLGPGWFAAGEPGRRRPTRVGFGLSQPRWRMTIGAAPSPSGLREAR